MGTGEGQDGKRAVADAVQGRIYVPPDYIQLLHGIRTKTELYRVFYAIVGSFCPLWKLLFPKYVTTTECVGRVMLNVAKRGAPKSVLENQGINNVCRNGS